MRPRSTVLSKGGLLLPTITEGTEETLKDLNEANTQHVADHVSSDDYLLSICHLAHPTFPTGNVTPDTQQLNSVRPRIRVSRLNHRQKAHDWGVQKVENNEVLGCSDPLEYLYGRHNDISTGQSKSRAYPQQSNQRQIESEREKPSRSRAYSIPHTASPGLPRQRKSSCPDIHTNTTIPSVSAKHNRPTLTAEMGKVSDNKVEGEEGNPNKRHSLVSQWISDCRSAWREGRMRACMLPAITEI
ncbi:uncharacterized protein si:dkeyp-72g9.4 [Corythoichthys intestinalis]|uniref:uncharacterized protein si:dkeyp-72g9.4 n=1 Tax=Corythoichthys intestinalis TaxID=161448 RepID=UPI0025A56921|nr:uncharacterized protein si:dkeyp-72g9.4 [Corythoichthys intestinalis]